MKIRAPLQRRHRWPEWFGASAVVFALLLCTTASVGVTWDEPIYSQAAENAARWFGTLLRGGPGAAFEQSVFGVGWGLVNEHPPLVRVLNGLGWTLTRGILPRRPPIGSEAWRLPPSPSACWLQPPPGAPGRQPACLPRLRS